MSKEQKIITKEDLLPLDAYTKVRRQMRKELVEFKKNRRILLGPYACLLYTSPSPRDVEESRMPSSA